MAVRSALHEYAPTRTGPLIAICGAQLVMISLILAAVGEALAGLTTMGGSGQSSAGSELILIVFAFGPLIGATYYAACDAGHHSPVLRTAAALATYLTVTLVATFSFLAIDEPMMIIAPLLGTSVMLAIILPTSSWGWIASRLIIPPVPGLLALSGFEIFAEGADISFSVWMWILSVSLVLGLAAVRVTEHFRPGIDACNSSVSTSSAKANEQIDDHSRDHR